MPAVLGVGMAVVSIVRVVAVLNGLMATIRTVLVRMTGVLRVLTFHLSILCRQRELVHLPGPPTFG